jgi:two-component system LytT family response regulator
MKRTCLLVEDEPPAMDRLRVFLKQHRDIEIVAECRNAIEAAKAITRLRPDVLFLDIQIPGKNGFELLRELSPPLPLVIFVTAYDDFAVQAFEVNAIDYLLKPFDQERVAEALSRIRRMLDNNEQNRFQERIHSLLRQQDQPKYLKRLLIKSAGRSVFLNVSEMDWIEAKGNYVQIHAGRKSWLLRETMNGFERQLDPEEFLRIHRGFLVRVNAIREIKELTRGQSIIVLADGTQLPLSRRYRSRLPRAAE